MTAEESVPEPENPDVAEGTPADAADALDYVVVTTPEGRADGVVRCQRCGATEVEYSASKGTLRCAFCRYTWTEQSLDQIMGLSDGIADLVGTHVSSAAVDIEDGTALVTIKCTGCGAEVIIDTDHNLSARCHWCKHTLSINNRVPNGAVPDGILPYSVTKEQAMRSIQAFVDERKTFAHPAFSESFKAENVMGFYMPYMTVDGNVEVRLDGAGEILRRTARVNDKQTEYHADEYAVMRELSMVVDDLIVETSSSKVDIHSTTSTNNIINAVLPFDVKNIVRFNSNFLGSEYTSERRDMDVDAAEAYAASHFMTLARAGAAPTLGDYNRGVRWESEQVSIKGSRWVAVLLPVWLYGFVETRGSRQITHYIAVNGRTGATMGSVPINRKKAHLVAWGTAAIVSLVTWPIAIVVLVLGG
jgi:ribosomal protein S27E